MDRLALRLGLFASEHIEGILQSLFGLCHLSFLLGTEIFAEDFGGLVLAVGRANSAAVFAPPSLRHCLIEVTDHVFSSVGDGIILLPGRMGVAPRYAGALHALLDIAVALSNDVAVVSV